MSYRLCRIKKIFVNSINLRSKVLLNIDLISMQFSSNNYQKISFYSSKTKKSINKLREKLLCCLVKLRKKINLSILKDIKGNLLNKNNPL